MLFLWVWINYQIISTLLGGGSGLSKPHREGRRCRESRAQGGSRGWLRAPLTGLWGLWGLGGGRQPGLSPGGHFNPAHPSVLQKETVPADVKSPSRGSWNWLLKWLERAVRTQQSKVGSSASQQSWAQAWLPALDCQDCPLSPWHESCVWLWANTFPHFFGHKVFELSHLHWRRAHTKYFFFFTKVEYEYHACKKGDLFCIHDVFSRQETLSYTESLNYLATVSLCLYAMCLLNVCQPTSCK